MESSFRSQKFLHFLFFGTVVVGLYLTTFVNYLFFHSLVEIFSIVVAFSFFMITWNSRSYIKNQYLLFVGIAYLFIALLDLMHTLTYKGMPIFTDYDFYANQLWIGTRYLESVTLLAAFYFLGTAKVFNPEKLFFAYTIVTSVLIACIFYWRIFPVCFVEGQGLTAFKKISEYIICLLLLISMVLLYENRNRFDSKVYYILLLSIVCTIISELAFTFYISNYGLSNLIGHYFKLFSFYLIYIAIIETAVKKPYEIIFKELDSSNRKFKTEIKARIKVEEDKEKVIQDLKVAIAKVKTLGGLLPICSHCKKICDDKGYWNQIESYIRDHSDAEFSHSICQECAKKYYPDFDIYGNEPSED